MTDLALRQARRWGRGLGRNARSRPTGLAVFFAAFALASGAGLFVGRAAPGDAGAFEPNLVLLLRFMAAIKFAGVIGAFALVAWRLTRPVSPGLGLGYLGAVSLMALAPGLIWSLAHIGLAAFLFHVGLLVFLMLARGDRDALVVFGGRRVRPDCL